jgi:cytochrome c-type biogenesis protein CcmH/NrfG
VANVLRRRVGVAIVAGAAILCYINTLGNDFTLDDVVIVQKNPLVTGEMDASAIWTTDYWFSKRETTPNRDLLYRPMTILTYRLNAMVCGMKPVGFHLVNLLLHALVSGMLFLVISRYVSTLAATMGGVLFAMMPIHVEAVAGVVGRAELLVGCLTLCSLLIVAKRPVFAAAFVFAAMLSKESGVAAALIVPVWALIVRRQQPNPSSDHEHSEVAITRRSNRYWATLITSIFAAIIGYTLLRWHALDGRLIDSNIPSAIDNVLVDAGAWQRILSAAMLLGMYLAKTVWPAVLVMDYSFASVVPATSILDIYVLIGIFFGAVSVLILWRGSPMTRFIVPAMWASYFPVSNSIVLIKTTFAERIWYVPSIWLAALLTLGIGRLIMKTAIRRGVVVLVCVVSMMGVARCWLRNAQWRDNETLFASAYRDQPESVVVLASYGQWLCQNEQLQKGIPLLQEAATIQPGFTSAHYWLGQALLSAGRPQEAMQRFVMVRSQNPDHPDLDHWINKARAQATENSSNSLESARAAVSANPGDWTVMVNYVSLLQSIGRHAEAIDIMRASDVHFSNRPEFHLLSARLLMEAGQLDRAVEEYEQVLSIDDSPTAMVELAMILLERGSPNDRRRAFGLVDSAWSMAPADGQVRIARAVTWALMGRSEDAANIYRGLLDQMSQDDPRRSMFEAQIRALGDEE